MPTISEFLAHAQGQRFADVVNDTRIPFRAVLEFFNEPGHQLRMEEAQRRGQPALAGVAEEFESLPEVDRYFRNQEAQDTRRFRQAIGVLVRMIMEAKGWSRTGRKGYLGQRANVAAGTASPPPLHSVSETPRWFNLAEHFQPPRGLSEPLGTPALNTSDPDEATVTEAKAQRSYADRVRQALDALEQIGTEPERRETLEQLMTALAESRRNENRPF